MYVGFMLTAQRSENVWIAHFATLGIFIGIILLVEYVLRTNYSARKSGEIEESNYTRPLDLKLSKKYIFVGALVIFGLIFFAIRMLEESKLFEFIVCIGVIIALFKYAHFGDFRFLGRRFARIDSKGVSHYKHGFIAWDKIREVSQHTSTYRGLKTGKVMYIRLNDSLTPERKKLYKKWEGILFRDSRLIVLPVSLFDKPSDTVIAAIENLFRQNGGVDVAVIKNKLVDHERLVEERAQANLRKASFDEISTIDKKITLSLNEISNNLSQFDDDMGDEQLKNLFQTKKLIQDEEQRIIARVEEYAGAGPEIERASISKNIAEVEKLNGIFNELTDINNKINRRQRQLQNAKGWRVLFVVVLALLIYGAVKLSGVI